MVQLECPRVIHPLLSFTFGFHYGVPFPLHAGKGKSCMWLGNKVEIHFPKMGFIDGHTSLSVIHFWVPLHSGKTSCCRNTRPPEATTGLPFFFLPKTIIPAATSSPQSQACCLSTLRKSRHLWWKCVPLRTVEQINTSGQRGDFW